MSEQNTRAIDPNLPAIGVRIVIYNNDGTKTIYDETVTGVSNTAELQVQGQQLVAIGGAGVLPLWTYNSNGVFIGLAKYANSTTPDLVDGGAKYPLGGLPFASFYLVSFEYETVKVEYNGAILGTVTKGSPKTLNCKDKIMKSNVKITKI